MCRESFLQLLGATAVDLQQMSMGVGQTQTQHIIGDPDQFAMLGKLAVKPTKTELPEQRMPIEGRRQGLYRRARRSRDGGFGKIRLGGNRRRKLDRRGRRPRSRTDRRNFIGFGRQILPRRHAAAEIRRCRCRHLRQEQDRPVRQP